MTDLPTVIKNLSIPVLFAFNTNILFSHSNFKGFEENINALFETLNNLFKRHLLSIYFLKTHYTHFVTKNNTLIYMKIGYENKTIPSVTNTKFLGLTIDIGLEKSY
jgi:hypothetical protein